MADLSQISPDLIEELAASGAICETCGGVHALPGPAGMDAMIQLLNVELQSPTGHFVPLGHGLRERVVEIPWCTCAACPVCAEDPHTQAFLKSLDEERRRKETTPDD